MGDIMPMAQIRKKEKSDDKFTQLMLEVIRKM